MNYDCFLCYAKEDKSRVDEIYLKMKQHGLAPWMDKPPSPFEFDGILPGENWENRVKEAISLSKHFLPLFSKNSVEKRGYVQREYRIALNAVTKMPVGDVYIIPILLESCGLPSLEVEGVNFNQFQWWEVENEGLEKLLEFLKHRKSKLDGSASPATYIVNDYQQFLNSLRSDATIYLKGTYSSEGISLHERKFIQFNNTFDGIESCLRSLDNLVLEGDSSERALFLVKPSYSNVLRFDNCKNLTLKNLSFGHGPEKGECRGGVLYFHNCENIYIENCDLFGCGMEAVTLKYSKNIFVKNSVFRDCTYHIGTIDNTSNVTFDNCKVENNGQFTGVNISSSKEINFKFCNFTNNSFGSQFFYLVDSFQISITQCQFVNNKASELINSPWEIEEDSCSFSKNSWAK